MREKIKEGMKKGMNEIDRNEFTELTAIIKINQLYREDMTAEELYEATRGIWKRKLESVENCSCCLSVYKGTVVEVYHIDEWYPAGTTEYKTRTINSDRCFGRVEFTGNIADDDTRDRFLGRSVKGLYKWGEASPVKVFDGTD